MTRLEFHAALKKLYRRLVWAFVIWGIVPLILIPFTLMASNGDSTWLVWLFPAGFVCGLGVTTLICLRMSPELRCPHCGKLPCRRNAETVLATGQCERCGGELFEN